MKRKNASFAGFARRAQETGMPIYIYGAGMIGQTAAPYWLCEYGLERQVLCYIDLDPCKQGQSVSLKDRSVLVQGLSSLEQAEDPCLILVTVSAFDSVIETLERIPSLQDAEVYFLPVMLIEHAHHPKTVGVVRISNTPLIPKKLHYCWFSGNPIPDVLKRCIESWSKFCPDYEIIRWDESSYDISWSPYMTQAYQQKKWGFVPDIARLDILYRHGGIYLDTDVELIRGLDELLYQPAFCGVEKWGNVNIGGLSGAEKGNPVIKSMLDYRRDVPFMDANGSLNLTTCGYYETQPLAALGFQVNNSTQTLADGNMVVYSSDFFHPFDYVSGVSAVTENTFSIHHFSGSWLGEHAAEERERTRRKYMGFLQELGD